MKKVIKCISCRFARHNPRFSDKSWKAYECTNPHSDYYKCLLNLTRNGDKQHRISWNGCALGERRCSNDR